MNTRKIRAVIIDDEYLNRSLILDMVETLVPGFAVEGTAESVATGYEVLCDVKPDVVFIDVRMADGTGFDLLNKFVTIPFEVVFVTAYDEYARRGFDFNAIDYVVKPIDVNRFAETLNRVARRVTSGPYTINEGLREMARSNGVVQKIPVHYRDSVLLFDVSEIISLSADHGCTVFSVDGKGKFTSSKQLSDFDVILEPFSFFSRISKGVYVNINYVQRYSKGTSCIIDMKDGVAFEVSRRKKAEMLEVLAASRYKVAL